VKRGAIDVCVALGYENPAQTVADHVDGDDLSKRYAIDVCVALGYTNPSKAVADHVDDKDLTKRYALAAGGRVQQTTSAVARLYSQQRMDI
jgi:prophage antirepressor-like protein